MAQILVPSIILGIISSLITEILKFVPWFRETDRRKRSLAFLICLFFTFTFNLGNPDISGLDWLAFLILTLSMSYTTFKTIVQELFSKSKAELGLIEKAK